MIKRKGLLRRGFGFEAARKNHCIFDRIRPALSQKRQHGMRCIAEQHDAAARPLVEPGTAEQAPLEDLASHRSGNYGSGPLVEARELLEEFVQRCRDHPALCFPLVSLCNRDEIQQFAAPDQVTVDVPALSESDCRLTQMRRQIGGIDQPAPGPHVGRSVDHGKRQPDARRGGAWRGGIGDHKQAGGKRRGANMAIQTS